MVQNLVSVGPPLQGPPSWNSSKPERPEESKGSFDRTLAESMNSKPQERPLSKVDEPKGRRVQGQDDQKEIAEPRPRKEPTANSLEKRAAMLRQKAIEQFMDSFESEFSIPPTRFVEALSQLPPEELMLDPELTADSVIAQLDLGEEDQIKAREMYLTLLLDLNRIEKSTAAPVLVAADPQAVMGSQSKERFILAQEKKSMLNQSLDRLNRQFWMKTPTSEPMAQQPIPMAGENPELMSMNMWEQQMLSEETPWRRESPMGPDELTGLRPPGVEPEVTEAPAGALAASKNAKPSKANLEAHQQMMQEFSKLSQESQMPLTPQESRVLDKAALSGMGLRESLQPSNGPMDAAVSSEVPLQGFAQRNPQQMGQEGFGQNDSSNGQGKDSSTKPMKSLGLDAKAGDFMVTHPSLMNVEGPSMSSSTPVPGAVVAAGASDTAGEANSEASIRQIMNQAQYLIKKGGGEVNVQMSPEGMGKVQMKVVVNDGKVNVQMATESKEAKKILESSVSDLRSGLAAHKLSVDQVKIDVVSGTNTDNQAQSDTTNFDSHAQRESQKQFWNQFQESFGNRSQKDSFFNVPNLKGYGQKRSDPLTSVEESSKGRRTSESKGRGLDLVA